MKILEIKISELPSFIESPEFNNSKILPITRARAISQFNNPDASSEDTALLIAINDHSEITGYIGILPGKVINNGVEEKIFWNSGWWVDPEKGRNVSMLLFYKMVEVCRNRIVIADLTEHTTKILSYSGFFELPPAQKGIRAFLRFTTATILPNKFPFLKKVSGVLLIMDTVLNFLASPFLIYKQRCKLPGNYSLSVNNTIDTELSDFIDKAQKNTTHFRNARELEWILKYPWIRKGNKKSDSEAQRYYFSTVSQQFENIWLKIKKEGNLVACAFLTRRDNEYKMPYFFCLSDNKQVMFKIFIDYMNRNKAIAFTTWQKDFVEYLLKQSPFLIKKEVNMQSAYSKDLSQIFQNGFYLQDGDGDMAFT
jgi:hypothetical protein